LSTVRLELLSRIYITFGLCNIRPFSPARYIIDFPNRSLNGIVSVNKVEVYPSAWPVTPLVFGLKGNTYIITKVERPRHLVTRRKQIDGLNF